MVVTFAHHNLAALFSQSCIALFFSNHLRFTSAIANRFLNLGSTSNFPAMPAFSRKVKPNSIRRSHPARYR